PRRVDRTRPGRPGGRDPGALRLPGVSDGGRRDRPGAARLGAGGALPARRLRPRRLRPRPGAAPRGRPGGGRRAPLAAGRPLPGGQRRGGNGTGVGGAAAGQLVLDATTGDPERTAAVAAGLAGHGVGYVDAAVVGSSEQARAGDAVALVGGDGGDV